MLPHYIARVEVLHAAPNTVDELRLLSERAPNVSTEWQQQQPEDWNSKNFLPENTFLLLLTNFEVRSYNNIL